MNTNMPFGFNPNMMPNNQMPMMPQMSMPQPQMMNQLPMSGIQQANPILQSIPNFPMGQQFGNDLNVPMMNPQMFGGGSKTNKYKIKYNKSIH